MDTTKMETELETMLAQAPTLSFDTLPETKEEVAVVNVSEEAHEEAQKKA